MFEEIIPNPKMDPVMLPKIDPSVNLYQSTLSIMEIPMDTLPCGHNLVQSTSKNPKPKLANIPLTHFFHGLFYIIYSQDCPFFQ